MSQLESLSAALRDPRLAAHATSALPVWLWTADGAHVVWANPAAAAILGGDAPTSLSGHDFSAHTAGRQIAGIAGTLPHGGAPRLERLRGLGARLGGMLTCACSRAEFDGRPLIVVASAEPAGPDLPPRERMRRLFAGCGGAIAVYSSAGELLHATPLARPIVGAAGTLDELGAGALIAEATSAGQAKGEIAGGEISVDRIGAGAGTIFVAALRSSAEAPPAQIDISPIAQAMARAATEDARAAKTSFTPLATEDQADRAPEIAERRHPLRFVWQMDAEGHFSLGSDEFTEVIGPKMATALGRRWSEISDELRLDPERRVERAIASRETWSALTVAWPVEGSPERLPVELSGLPIFDRNRQFRGYRGFGVCRDVTRLTALIAARRAALLREDSDNGEQEAGRDFPAATPSPTAEAPAAGSEAAGEMAAAARNVVPFRVPPLVEPKPAVLTQVEGNAFRELAQELSDRLQGKPDAPAPKDEIAGPNAPAVESARETSPAEPTTPIAPANGRPIFDGSLVQDNALAQAKSSAAESARDARQEKLAALMGHAAPPGGAPTGIAIEPENAPKPTTADEREVLDRLPLGVLVYRLDEFLYANRAFLEWTGHATLTDFVEGGGLENLLLDSDGASADTDPANKPLLITAADGGRPPQHGRLHPISWSGEPAIALIFAPVSEPSTGIAPAPAAPDEAARELASILDTATDGVIMLDRSGGILSSNRSAQALFGYDAAELAGRNLTELFAPESRHAATSYLEGVAGDGVASLLNDGREVIGRVREGGLIPLFITMGRASDSTEKFCAVFRDITQWKKAEEELVGAKLQAEKASTAKSEFLAKVSHEIRTPLNAIIGFSEVMMDERFGPIGNDRYREYLKDINASGAHLVSLLNDLLDLSKIEAGKLELNFAEVNLNELTQQCVALMQQQANNQRIIIRTSLSPQLSPIVADGRSVRQIVLNLLSNSIKFTGAGGQVIVSTALTDDNAIALRVRDTGVGMSEKELKIALEPFRQLTTSPRSEFGGTGLGLPLTKALAEANRARFSIRSAINDGTLVEILFPLTRVSAQ